MAANKKKAKPAPKKKTSAVKSAVKAVKKNVKAAARTVKAKAVKAAKTTVAKTAKTVSRATKPAAPAKKVVAKAAAPKAKSAATPAVKTSLSSAALAKVLQPLDDRLVVVVEGESEMTAGGIIIPGTVSSRPNRGRVVAKGPGKRTKKGLLRPLDVSVGDAILFPEFAGTTITVSGQELLILREDEVLGITT